MIRTVIIVALILVFSFNILASDTINDFYNTHENFMICFEDSNNSYVNDKILQICTALESHLEKNYHKEIEVKGISRLQEEDLENKNLILYILSDSTLLKNYNFPIISIEDGFSYLGKKFTNQDAQLITLIKSPFNSQKDILIYLANSWTYLLNINQVDHGKERSVVAKNGKKLDDINDQEYVQIEWLQKETEHFSFLYIENTYAEEKINYISSVRENLISKAKNILKIPWNEKRIVCYLYNTLNQKYSYTGTYFFAEAFPILCETHEVLNNTRQANISTIHEPLHILLNTIGHIDSYFIEEGIVVYVDKYLLKGVSFKQYLSGEELNNINLEKMLYSGYEIDDPYLTVLFIDFLLKTANLDISSLVDELYDSQNNLTETLFYLTETISFEDMANKWKKYLRGE